MAVFHTNGLRPWSIVTAVAVKNQDSSLSGGARLDASGDGKSGKKSNTDN
jgi:hypothetical protein